MKIIFMGTPDIAFSSLEYLYDKHEIAAVFTQPDKPNTRGNKIVFSPVKEFALKKNIPVYQPSTMKDGTAEKIIREINPDILVVVAYGKILPNAVIEAPKYGAINLHASLLPKYRGASPIHASVVNGDEKTGITVMYINEFLDQGDMILKKEVEIKYTDTVGDIYDKLADIGKHALDEALKLIESGNAKPEKQNDLEATFTRPIGKDECRIDWSKGKREIYNFVRGLNPFPVAFTTIDDKRMKIYDVEESECSDDIKEGTVAALVKGKGPMVKTRDGGIILINVKPENKGMISGVDLINGNYVKVLDRFI